MPQGIAPDCKLEESTECVATSGLLGIASRMRIAGEPRVRTLHGPRVKLRRDPGTKSSSAIPDRRERPMWPEPRLDVSARPVHRYRALAIWQILQDCGNRVPPGVSGSQIRTSVVPSFSGINVCSMTRSARGNVVTVKRRSMSESAPTHRRGGGDQPRPRFT